jgi:tRNA threonylcarbamoyladenosine biosynthesis protein TsaE
VEEIAPVIPPLVSRGRLALTEPELLDWGERLGRLARPPLIIGLSGELGSGKTTLARAICRGYGVGEDVTSPTFAIVHEYRAERSPVFHVDLFRVRNEGELRSIGWDELLTQEALILIEWPERAGAALPTAHVPISLQHLDDDPQRRLLYAGGHVGEHKFGDHS